VRTLQRVLGCGASFCCLMDHWQYASVKQEGGQGAHGFGTRFCRRPPPAHWFAFKGCCASLLLPVLLLYTCGVVLLPTVEDGNSNLGKYCWGQYHPCTSCTPANRVPHKLALSLLYNCHPVLRVALCELLALQVSCTLANRAVCLPWPFPS